MFALSSTVDKLKLKLRYAEEEEALMKKLFYRVAAERDLAVRQHNELVQRINQLGGQEFLDGEVPHPNAKSSNQFTDAELKSLLQLVHPDKNGGSEVSIRLTQKINSLRS